jgi:SAM-dependent methyltransferase
MKQNLYDNPEFFSGYKALRDSNAGLNEVLEQPAIKSLLPDLNGKSILELGCGTGELCRYLTVRGAKSVVGVDISGKMLEIAIKETTTDRISFVESSIEDYDTGIDYFDIVVSSLTFHYVADLGTMFNKINACLKADGCLVFSIEHPIATCSQGIHPGWEKDDSGRKKYWQVDEYSSEGIRKSHWFVDGAIKYHRQLSSILNSLLDNGFQIERVLEPHAFEEAERKRPDLLAERRRPPFLMVSAHKKGNGNK